MSIITKDQQQHQNFNPPKLSLFHTLTLILSLFSSNRRLLICPPLSHCHQKHQNSRVRLNKRFLSFMSTFEKKDAKRKNAVGNRTDPGWAHWIEVDPIVKKSAIYERVFQIINKIWEDQLGQSLHTASYFLNPQYQYSPDFQLDVSVKRGLYNCIDRIVEDLNERLKIDMQLDDFRDAKGLFGIQNAILTRNKKSSAYWWESYGDGCPELKRFAIRILSLTCSSSGCELSVANSATLHCKSDIGIPYILLGIPLTGLETTRRLGTPNYIAPEQWQAEVRGPISIETDWWGFAFSIVEMLTGEQPWSGKSVDEIYKSFVRRQERAHIPAGLPPSVENIISGCFEYDFRSRPLVEDILYAFKSSQNAVFQDGRIDPESRKITEKSSFNGYSKWFLLKDHLLVGDMVRSRKPPNSCKPENMEVPEGTIVGLHRDSDQNGYVLVRVHGIHDPIRVNGSTLERVTFGLAAGDWVRLRAEEKKH